VCPIGRKSRFAAINGDKAKEVFEAAILEELSALDIEENVPGVGTRQPSETFRRNDGQPLDIIGAGSALGGLQHCLMPQAIKGVLLDAGNP